MPYDFDPGYAEQPFRELCTIYPDQRVYPPSDFRVEWGPIFHRGRLDGTAKIIVIGQDPAAHEVICRRILVGLAGCRIQGFLAKLGLNRSYVMLNTFIYCQYQSDESRFATQPEVAAYRRRWLDAVLKKSSGIRAVVSLGQTADLAWKDYVKHSGGPADKLFYAHITHPTEPFRDSGGDPQRQKELTAKMLVNWNAAIEGGLRAALKEATDRDPDTRAYEASFRADEVVTIPDYDLPSGLPEWMRTPENWSLRTATGVNQRWQVTVTVPPDARVSARRLAIRGRVVTMASAGVLEDGVVYVEDERIVAVRRAADGAPSGFEKQPVEQVGSVYPGLIDLHSHSEYHFLSPWSPARKFQDRDLWRNDPEYQELVTAPARVAKKHFAPFVARYVDCKFLLAGVTTATAVRLANPATGAERQYQGAVRDIAGGISGAPALPGAAVWVFEPRDHTELDRYLRDLAQSRCVLLHLSEGTDLPAYRHFQQLAKAKGFDRALSAIHCLPLDLQDFEKLFRAGCSLVWSPYSNLVLYGQTLRLDDVVQAGMDMALGTDWSVTGSRNILWELKAARVVSAALETRLTDRQLVEMVTVNPSRMLGWETAVGSLEGGKLADLVCTRDTEGDPYEALVEATEESIELVLVNGVPRSGQPETMARITGRKDLEKVTFDGYVVAFDLSGLDKLTEGITLSEARTKLQDVFKPGDVWPVTPEIELVLDYDEPPEPTKAAVAAVAGRHLEVDPMLTSGDAGYLSRVAATIPDPQIADGLAEIYKKVMAK